jgi:hypothetical protein
MTAVTDDYVGRVIETGSDREMGRWSYTRLLGKHGRIIVVVSIYQVCNQQASTVGDRTAFAQQLSLLRRNGKDCSPRKLFLDDLDKQLEEWTEKGYEILLSGGINEELGSDINGFACLSARWNLVEIIQHFHGVEDEPPTYARGSKRLDYAFCIPPTFFQASLDVASCPTARLSTQTIGLCTLILIQSLLWAVS